MKLEWYEFDPKKPPKKNKLLLFHIYETDCTYIGDYHNEYGFTSWAMKKWGEDYLSSGLDPKDIRVGWAYLDIDADLLFPTFKEIEKAIRSDLTAAFKDFD